WTRQGWQTSRPGERRARGGVCSCAPVLATVARCAHRPLASFRCSGERVEGPFDVPSSVLAAAPSAARVRKRSMKGGRPMHSFAQELKATHCASAKTATLNRAERSIGNQAFLRLPQGDAEALSAASSSATSPSFGHDFSQISIYPSQARAHAAQAPAPLYG